MTATNRQRTETARYEAVATGTVERNGAGAFVEHFKWTNAGTEFSQQLSLDPDVPPSVPDLAHAPPALIGPMTDLLTFYADLWLAAKQPSLVRGGDQVYVQHGTPSSWADGSRVLVGEDSIDFDITLSEVNTAKGTAQVVVRHVPPARPQIHIPAEWMKTTDGDRADNWIEVTKTGERKYVAEIGQETFEVVLIVSLADGRILSATMDNPVSVLARECVDNATNDCGEPERYQIRREVDLRLEK
jgi:hypothetical protein